RITIQRGQRGRLSGGSAQLAPVPELLQYQPGARTEIPVHALSLGVAVRLQQFDQQWKSKCREQQHRLPDVPDLWGRTGASFCGAAAVPRKKVKISLHTAGNKSL